MVSFDDIKNEFTSNWNTSNIQLPTIEDRDLKYTAKYPHYLFLKVYSNMKITPITQTSDGGYVRRHQYFQVFGIYDSYANAKLSLQEIKRIVTEKQGWYILGNSSIIQNRKRFIFELPCYEKKYLQKSEW